MIHVDEESKQNVREALTIVGDAEKVDKFLDKVKEQARDKGKFIAEAIKMGFFTRKEYNKEFKERYLDKESGIDGFGQLCYALVMTKRNNDKRHENIRTVFVTCDDKLLSDKEFLEKRFDGLVIATPEEAQKIMTEESNKEQDEFDTIFGRVLTVHKTRIGEAG